MLSAEELRSWLQERISDPDDAIVDELQESLVAELDAEDEANGILGSDEYLENVAKLKENDNKRCLDTKKYLESKAAKTERKKLWDGTRFGYYSGHVDAQGRPHGQGVVVYENKDVFRGQFSDGAQNRSGTLQLCSNHEIIEGTWKDGLLEGEAILRNNMNNSFREAHYKKGVFHGFQREFGGQKVDNKPLLLSFGRYYRGIKRGFHWQGCMGNGYICINVDDKMGNGVYVYLDLRTALVGRFDEDNKLVRAELKTVKGAKVERGVFTVIVDDNTFIKGPPLKYVFENASSRHIGDSPLLRDPYESQCVEVRESLLPRGGEGLFAKCWLKKNTIISYFSGIRLRRVNESLYGHSDYRIRLNADIDLDIPEKCTDTSVYCATLAHKANHAFLPNVKFVAVHHPRFGLIRALQSLRDIEEDEEILVNYTINLGEAPKWYQQLWVEHQRNYKKLNDEAIKRMLDKYYDDLGKRIDVELNVQQEFEVPRPQGCDMEELMKIELEEIVEN